MTEVRLKHQEISDALAREIRSGKRGAGEQLPGEVALARHFGVSRTTVRAALAELSDAGLIATRTGKGSYVLFDGHPLDDRFGWARALADQGVASRVRTIAVRRIADAGLARRLNVAEPDFVLVERIRELTEQDAAVSYERSYLPAVPGVLELPERGPAEESLTAVMHAAGLLPHHGEQRVSGRRIDEHEAGLLRRQPGDWFLHTSRTSLAADDSFVEHVVSLLDPEHFQLSLRFG